MLRTVKTATTAIAFAFATATSVLAQSTTPAIPEVGQPELSPSQIAAGRDVVIASGMSRSFSPMVPQLADQIVPMLTKTRPELKTNLVEVMKQLQPEFDQKGDEMITTAGKIYARAMTEQELKDTAAFFNSLTGKKYVISQPGMLDQLVVAMQSWTQSLSTFMMQRVHDEMKKRGQDF